MSDVTVRAARAALFQLLPEWMPMPAADLAPLALSRALERVERTLLNEAYTACASRAPSTGNSPVVRFADAVGIAQAWTAGELAEQINLRHGAHLARALRAAVAYLDVIEPQAVASSSCARAVEAARMALAEPVQA